jgi:hypothetical protein
MASNKELEAGLKTMAEDFHLPGGGRKKLSQLVAGHLSWFDAAERRGMGWQDMIRALTAAGVTSRGGRPLSVGTLSSTVWRERAEAGEKTDRPSPRQRCGPPEPLNADQKSPGEAKRLPARNPQRRKRAASSPISAHVQGGPAAATPSKNLAGEARVRSNKDLLAFMERARARRQRSE